MTQRRTGLTAWTVAALLGVAIATAGEVLAQSASGSLAGSVLTEAGEGVPGAVVQARFETTGAVRSVVTDVAGRYRLEGLGLGTWTVVARLGDGGLSDTRVVAVHLQQTAKVDFRVGRGLSEVVTVKAESPLVDRKDMGGKLFVTREQADGLPLGGRAFADLALLDSSVRQAPSGNFSGERGAVFVVNGQSGRSNSFLVDGLDNNDQTSGTNLDSFFSQQVVQEFVLQTHQYAPEFGRASGGVLNIVTRRGSNDLGWGAFLQGTAGEWNEPGRFLESLPDAGVSRDAVGRFAVGATVGGPIVKDRAFFFAAYEHQNGRGPLPYTGIDSSGLAGGRVEAPSEDDNFFVRTDFNLGPRHSLMVRLSADDRANEGVGVGGVSTPEYGFRIDERDLQLAGTLTSVLGPDLLAETRFLAATSSFDQVANSDRPGVQRPSGWSGGNILNGQLRDEGRFQIVQNLTWKVGVHMMKFGADIAHSRTRLRARFNPNGSFLYNWDFPFEPGDCGDITASEGAAHGPNGAVSCPGQEGVDDDDDGTIDEDGNIFSYPVVYSLINEQPRAVIDDTKIALFAQDKWEIGPKWFLEYGMRYDLSTYELPSSARVPSSIPNGGSERDADNVAPRFGVTYAPGARNLVFRAGGGLFYDKIVLAFPAVAAITSGTKIQLLFPQGFAFEEVTEATVEENADAVRQLMEDLQPFLGPLILRFSTGQKLNTPYSVQYNIGVEQAVGSHSAWRADLLRTRGYHLPLLKDLNPVSGLIPVGVDCNAQNVDPSLDVGIPCHLRDPTTGSIAALVSQGRSWYTGLDLSWRWSRDDEWFRASYTWSKAEDTGFDPLKDGISLPPNSDDLGAERGRADGDRRHRLVVSGSSGLPWMGLQASSVIQLSSGIPFNVTTGQDDNWDGILNDRPPGVDRNAGENASLDAINAVRDNPVVPLAPIGSLREPAFFQVDLRLARPFVLKSRGRGSIFLQVFNLLDRENAGLIEGRAISPNFGRTISLAGPPRTLELGLQVGY